jgi:hypothetical protein
MVGTDADQQRQHTQRGVLVSRIIDGFHENGYDLRDFLFNIFVFAECQPPGNELVTYTGNPAGIFITDQKHGDRATISRRSPRYFQTAGNHLWPALLPAESRAVDCLESISYVADVDPASAMQITGTGRSSGPMCRRCPTWSLLNTNHIEHPRPRCEGTLNPASPRGNPRPRDRKHGAAK